MRVLISLFTLSFFHFSYAQPTGPNAPEVSIQYVSSVAGFSFHLSNPTLSNNYFESYLAFDSTINAPEVNQYWKFQGYMIFQLRDDSIDFDEMFNPEHAQLAAVVDVIDTITSVNLMLSECNFIPIILENSGGLNDIIITNDAFTNVPFQENETFCFRVVAFAKNNHSFDAACGISDFALIGHTEANGLSIPSYCVVASETLSLSDIESDLFEIGPNPTSGEIFIKNYSKNTLPFKVSVIDELGQIVIEKIFFNVDTKLDLPHSGVYTVKIETEEFYTHKKIIRF